MCGGPWGALCGTIAFGVYCSCAVLTTYGGGQPLPTINPTATNGGNVVLSANPYETAGELHNATMQYILTSGIAITSKNTQQVYGMEVQYLSGQMQNFSFDYTPFTNCIAAESTYSYDFLATINGLNSQNLISGTVDSFCTLYFNTLDGLSNTYDPNDSTSFVNQMIANAESYYPQFVNIVMGAQDINKTDQQYILMNLSVLTYSYIFHTYNMSVYQN
jgi:hypothetical protein